MQEIEIDQNKLCNDLDAYINDIKTLDYRELKYEQFFYDFVQKNVPCVVKNVSSDWQCTKKWIKEGRINLEYLKQTYGLLEAPVADCGSITFNSQCKSNMKVSDYMCYLKDSNRKKLLYLKDWHLKRMQPDDQFYEVPFIFASDWLNEYAIDNKEDDFMFVYIGPKDSWTPLHADVYCSYSWSVNVIGKKKWILFPPGEEDKLKDNFGNLPLLFDTHTSKDIKYFEIIQEQGDALFVPSGWHHQVVNLIDTISVNHNWVNACNIETVLNALEKCLLSVENEIKEFKGTPEFTSQCQLILKSLFGMDFCSFIKFVCYIGQKRSKQLKGEVGLLLNTFKLGINHITYDLENIFKILNVIHNHPLFLNKILPADIELDCKNVYNTISQLLNK